jgi:hypothetical protein
VGEVGQFRNAPRTTLVRSQREANTRRFGGPVPVARGASKRLRGLLPGEHAWPVPFEAGPWGQPPSAAKGKK